MSRQLLRQANLPNVFLMGAQTAFYLTLAAALAQLLPHTADWTAGLVNIWLSCTILIGGTMCCLRLFITPLPPPQRIFLEVPEGYALVPLSDLTAPQESVTDPNVPQED